MRLGPLEADRPQTYAIGPSSGATDDSAVQEAEMQELCADWVTVYKDVSREVLQQPGAAIGEQEY